jgi:hypothetical protein
MNTQHDQAGKFLKIACLTALGFGLLMVSSNYLVDRYYVFHPQEGVFEEFLEPNTRVLKAHFLAEHCQDFNAIIMGSSRDVAYQTAAVNGRFDVNSYNYAVASGNLRGTLARLQWLANQGCLPQRIFLPISIDRLHLPPLSNDLLRKEFPGITPGDTYKREFLLSYLGSDALISNLRKLSKSLRGKDAARFRYDLSTGDVNYLWDRDVQLSNCPHTSMSTDALVIQTFAEYLEKIRSLADTHDATITLIWNPISIADQLAHIADAKVLLQSISASFSRIYRLPLQDPRLSSSSHFHDPGHFKTELGTAVLSSEDNEVSLDELISELEQRAQMCGRQEI